MDPTQQLIPPPADVAAIGGAAPDPTATTGLMPRPQAMNPPLINMGVTTAPLMPPPGAVLPPHPAPSMPPPGAMGAAVLPVLPQTLPPPQLNPMMQFPGITDPIILGQLTGYPGELLANSPSLMAGAQQFLAQRMMMQQQNMLLQNMSQAGMAPVQGLIHPQQLQLMQQQRLQAQLAKQANPKPVNKGKLRGKYKKNSATASAATAADGTEALDSNSNNATVGSGSLPGTLPLVKEDPGGKVIWAKVANSPWWPAKILDQTKDRSYPPDADPPRPTAIPIRIFGSHDFAWVGSKRAFVDWEKGCAQGYSKQHKISADDAETLKFTRAVEEAETYLREKTLPDVFYIIPHVEQTGGSRKGASGGGKGRGKRGAGSNASGAHVSKKHASIAAAFEGSLVHDFPIAAPILGGAAALGGGTTDAMMTGFVPGFGTATGLPGTNGPFIGATGLTTKTRASRYGPELTAEERASLVFSRKKERLYDLGLAPPPESPFIKGVVPENPNLLAKLAEWEANAPEVMDKAKEHVAKPENSQPPRASLLRIPPPLPVVPHSAAAIAAMQSQNAAYMMGMGMMNMPLSLASFV